MTDTEIEMLKFASRATMREFIRVSDDGNGVMLAGIQEPWNPLTDDGDAFRLLTRMPPDWVMTVTVGRKEIECTATLLGLPKPIVFRETVPACFGLRRSAASPDTDGCLR